MIHDGAWAGRPAFVIGGGPSLKDFDFSRLAGELTLGLNMAFLHDPTANLVFDLRLMESLVQDPRWKAYKGAKLWLNSEIPNERGRFKDVVELRECLDMGRGPLWSTGLEWGIWRRTNAGASALNLAEILGADPIYLLGFDFNQKGNWHGEYPKGWTPDEVTLRGYIKDFEENVGGIRATVVNLNPESALRSFPHGHLRDVLRPKEAPK